MKYRKKPVVIDAVRWTGENVDEVWTLFDGNDGGYIDESGELYIQTLEGTHHATRGDWIIRGVAGEVYPCKPDIFEATYEPAETTVSA